MHEAIHTIRLAKREDLEKVIGLLVNTAGWLQTKGTKQWNYYLTDLEGNVDEIVTSIENKATYIVEKEGGAIATRTLESSPNEWDMDIWGEEAEDDVAYLHRLAVHRDFAGKRIGADLLDWAEIQMKTRGKKSIRFDCIASNEGLNRYYQERYRLREVIDIHGRHCKYEILLGENPV
ncbi:GNAT family N-acetyltransferase [Rossellomorea sp. NPDC077527]|uniref:GNAT family N-acetyltransferase n=1 Tax=Rossellomorea sp. NPDC077527 TaxID=3364510 RepID=UPI0037C82CA0